VRRNVVGQLALSAQENRPGNMLRETRRDMISRYIEVGATARSGWWGEAVGGTPAPHRVKRAQVMGPKLADITSGVLQRLFTKSEEMVGGAGAGFSGGLLDTLPPPCMCVCARAQVKLKVGTRIGTDCPTDLFSLMSEHLKIAKAGGSLALQRRLLSLLMVQFARYGTEVMLHIMDMWRSRPDGQATGGGGGSAGGVIQPRLVGADTNLPSSPFACVWAVQ
jgi:hypothetical protein